MKHINIRVSGKVHGVFYRATTKIVANQLGVKGFVQNEKDGSVYIEAEADDFEMDLFLEYCHKGPDKAVVENLETSEDSLKNFRNFEVKKSLS